MTNHKTVDYCSITLHHIAKECKVQLQNTQVSNYDKRILKVIKDHTTYLLQQIEEHRRVRNLVKDEDKLWIPHDSLLSSVYRKINNEDEEK